MAIAALLIKQGATLQLAISAKNADGSAFDLTSIVVSAEVRDAYLHLVDTLIITTTQPPTLGQLAVAQDTSTWPSGMMTCDLKFINGAIVLKSDSFTINVLAAVTE